MALFKPLPRRFVVAEESMAPVLRPGDSLFGITASRFRRGDIAVFEHPHRQGFWLVKRAVGLPGEQMEIADGALFIDGDRLEDLWGNGATAPDGRWEIPLGHVFALSDSRSVTLADSRTFGPVAMGGAYRVVLRLHNHKKHD
jgi:signal peptidase I